MKENDVIRVIQEWFIDKWLSKLFERRCLLLGLNQKEIKLFATKFLQAEKNNILAQLQRKYDKKLLPRRFNQKLLQESLFRIVKEYFLSTKDEEVLAVLNQYKNEIIKKRQMTLLLAQMHDWQQYAYRLLSQHPFARERSQQIWKKQLDIGAKQITSGEKQQRAIPTVIEQRYQLNKWR